MDWEQFFYRMLMISGTPLHMCLNPWQTLNLDMLKLRALGAMLACEKFVSYIQGKTITLETDHNPLVPLLSHKHFDSLPPRVLCFRLWLMRFDFVMLHVPGKHSHTADALSRAPLKNSIDQID